MSTERIGVIADLTSMREASGHTPETLAESAGLARGVGRDIESGACDPTLSTLLAYSNALGVDLLVVPRLLLSDLRFFIESGRLYLDRKWPGDEPPSVVENLLREEGGKD
jgi:transcriptional regulator with XRE-family HTH domain